MNSRAATKRRLLLAPILCATFVLWPQMAAATIITGTRNFQIVDRLTGPNITGHVGIGGTDLGHMVNHNGKTYFLFGDTFASEASAGSGGPDWRNNVMAWTSDTDPTDGLSLEGWLTRPNGTARQAIVPGFQPVTYIPTGAISVGDKIYAWYMHVSDWNGWTLSHAGLARWREGDSQFTVVPNYQFAAPAGGVYTTGHGTQGPGNFGMVAASYRSPLEHANDEHVYIWGTPGGREGGVKLARVLPGQIENLSAYQFFNGEVNGVPQWIDNEFNAQKIIPAGVGEMSVMYNEAMRAWTMMYIRGGLAPDFHVRYADNPWGPWSEPIVATRFDQAPGGIYAPYMNPLYVENGGRTIYYTMSLWNPYDVYLAKVDLDLDFRTHWEGTIGTWATDQNWSHGRPTAEHRTTLDNGGRIIVHTTESVRALYVGTGVGSGGTVQLWGAGNITVHAGGFRLGQAPGSNATLTMTGGAVTVLDASRLFLVGDHGHATAAISGGSITAPSFSVAHQPAANGHVELSGDAVITTTGGRFQMARLRNAATGSRSVASLTMTGGTINITNTGSGVADFVPAFEGVATVDLSGGTINVGSNFVAAVAGGLGQAAPSQATIRHSGGTINTGGMTLGERGISDYTLSGTGTINARGQMRLAWFAGSHSSFTQTGGTVSLALNNPVADFVGLKIGEGGQATYTINGGALHVPGRLWIGELAASVGRLNVGGGTVEVDGDLAVGLQGSAALTQTGGELRVGGVLSTAAGNSTTLSGGTLSASQILHNQGGMFNFTGGTLHVGTFHGDLTNAGGTLDPGFGTGITRIAGNYAQQQAAQLAIDIGGTVPGAEHDQLSVAGGAAISGELWLALRHDYVPSDLHTFVILTATTGISGQFSNVANGQRLQTIDGMGSFVVHYGADSAFDPNQIVLADFQLTAIPGDFNADGRVDAADYVLWRKTDGTPAGYDVWRTNIGRAVGSGATFHAAVPEPAALMMLLPVLLMLPTRRRYSNALCRQPL